MTDFKHQELTGKIIGCAMTVHSTLGAGFQEVIYQRALEIELTKNQISFKREYSMPVYYDGQEIGSRRVDFFIDDKVMLELKAVKEIEDIHIAQTMNYLEAFKIEIGLLINFGSKSLQFKRYTIQQKLNPVININQE
jgi:GxxExxY protein